MPISTPYTYTNGNVLVPDSHNRNIASTVASGEGLLSGPNGGIDASCLAPGFEITSESVQAEECVVARKEDASEALDFMDNAFSDTGDRRYISIPGAGIRFPVYFSSVTLLQWSLFVSPFRAIRYTEQGAQILPEVTLKMFLDGSPIQHTRRVLPVTAFINSANTFIYTFEKRSCLFYDMAHLASLTAGWHSLQVRLYMEVGSITNSLARSINSGSKTSTYFIKNRVTVGIRNARVLLMRGS
jgi:hypothetical protein